MVGRAFRQVSQQRNFILLSHCHRSRLIAAAAAATSACPVHVPTARYISINPAQRGQHSMVKGCAPKQLPVKLVSNSIYYYFLPTSPVARPRASGRFRVFSRSDFNLLAEFMYMASNTLSNMTYCSIGACLM